MAWGICGYFILLSSSFHSKNTGHPTLLNGQTAAEKTHEKKQVQNEHRPRRVTRPSRTPRAHAQPRTLLLGTAKATAALPSRPQWPLGNHSNNPRGILTGPPEASDTDGLSDGQSDREDTGSQPPRTTVSRKSNPNSHPADFRCAPHTKRG